MLKDLDKKSKKPKFVINPSIPKPKIRKSKTTTPYLTDPDTLSSFNQDESKSTIHHAKTRFDVSFHTQSSHHVITSPSVALYPEKNYEINTLCKEAHECISKKVRKNDICDYIERLEGKMTSIKEEIEKKKNENDLISEENLRMIFEQDKIAEEREFLKRQIPIEKEAIKKIRAQIIAVNIQKNQFEVETIKTREEIIQMQEKIKQLKISIEAQIKDNTKLKYEVQGMKRKVEEMKIKLNPNSQRYNNFIKDITKLIATK